MGLLSSVSKGLKSIGSGVSSVMKPFGDIGQTVGGIWDVAEKFLGGSDALDKSENIKYQRQSFAAKMADAEKFGLHPLFMLGAGGQSPPIVGGHGNPQGSGIGNSITEMSRNFSRLAEREAESRIYKNTAEGVRADTEAGWINQQAQASLAARATQNANVQQDKIPLYIDVWDNIAKEYIQLVNPELGLDAPEMVGGYYYAKGRTFGKGGEQNRGPYGPTNVSP